MATTFQSSVSIKAAGLANLLAESIVVSGTASGDSDIVNETQDIGTTTEAITTGEIAAGSALYLQLINLDAANFVTFGFASPVVPGTNTFKLKAGQQMLLTLPSGTLNALADTATVKILKKIIEA